MTRTAQCPVCGTRLTDIPDDQPTFACSGYSWGDDEHLHEWEPTEMLIMEEEKAK